MAMSRRNIMTLLGLSPIGGAAFANDDVFTLEDGKREMMVGAGNVQNESIATALENLAREMRAKGVVAESMRLTSDVLPNSVFTQELTIRFVVVEQDNPNA